MGHLRSIKINAIRTCPTYTRGHERRHRVKIGRVKPLNFVTQAIPTRITNHY